MLASVQFDDNCPVETRKVAYVETNLMLSTELEASQLPTAQTTPEKTFGVCGARAEFANMTAHTPIEAWLFDVNVA